MHQDQQKTPAAPTMPYYRDDEIDLADLLRALWAERMAILLTTLLVVVAAAVYLKVTPNVYESKALVAPTTERQIVQIAAIDFAPPVITQDGLFQTFKQVAASQTTQLLFLDQELARLMPDLSADAAKGALRYQYTKKLLAAFSATTLTEKTSPMHAGLLEVGFSGNDAQLVSDTVSRYIDYVQSTAKQKLSEDYNAGLARRKAALEAELGSLRLKYQEMSKSTLSRLKESYNIAASLGIHEDRTQGWINENSGRLAGGNAPVAAINAVKPPDYYRGTRALQAEMDALAARLDNDSFIEGVPKVIAELKSLERYKVNFVGHDIIDLRESPSPAIDPVKPKKALVLALSLVLGGMAGLMVAGIRRLFRNKEKAD